MRLTRKRAIELCIELWEWLAKTGKLKEDWPEWEIYGAISQYCWFCEYVSHRRQRYNNNLYCFYCPLIRKFNKGCESKIDKKDTFYDKWNNAKTPRTRKKYAKLFLEQIRQCK